MFRLDEDRVVDATLSGGLARYINHSCNPNCVTEIVDVDRECRIIIFAKRKITRGEEVQRIKFKSQTFSKNIFFFIFSCLTITNSTSKMTRIKYRVCVVHRIVANG